MTPIAHGLVVGKFMPAHIGHRHLVRFACGMCSHVTVVVDRLVGEWPDADARAQALARDLAGLPVAVVALPYAMPQEPEDHPRFWPLWRDALLTACGGTPDALVCSMPYGVPLAEVLGCALVPIDLARDALPVTATAIRSDPWARWDDMLPHARLPYLTRIAIEGPESTGKSTIGRAAAQASGFGFAPEWAKDHIACQVRTGRAFAPDDLRRIAVGHIAAERSLELSAHRVLLSDTSLLTTLVWSRYLYGVPDTLIERLFAEEEARAPRQRWLFTPDTPWVADIHRDVTADTGTIAERARFWSLLVAEADRWGLRYEVVPGGFAEKAARVSALAAALTPPERT